MTVPAAPGRCFGVGVGPGDPELITRKAARIVGECRVVASFAARGRVSNARRIAADLVRADHEELELVYPITTEAVPAGASYDTMLSDFYDESAKAVAEILDSGRDVAVLCEGDPFFFGSFMYLHNRLADRYETEVVPGVPAMLAGAARLGTPLVCRNEVVQVLSGVTPRRLLTEQLVHADAAVIIKVGRNLPAVVEAVCGAGCFERAYYVERVSMEQERVMPLAEAVARDVVAPYFSMVIVPSPTAAGR